MKNLILVFGLVLSASGASAKWIGKTGPEMRECIKNLDGCSIVSDLGTKRENSIGVRCTPERDPFSCHLVDEAWDVKLSPSCSLIKVRAACRVGIGHYEGTDRLHVGNWGVGRSCFVATAGLPPGGNPKGWCECGKRKIGKGFVCDESLSALGLKAAIIKHNISKYGSKAAKEVIEYFGD